MQVRCSKYFKLLRQHKYLGSSNEDEIPFCDLIDFKQYTADIDIFNQF